MTNLVGRNLGHYRIVEKIGEGGMGVVYRARDERLDRDVAVKVLPADVAGDPERLQRFEREAKAVAKLDHPNILAIHDFGREDGVTYAVMELLEGRSLRDVMKGGGLTSARALAYARAVADGLAEAHSKGVTHRDLKPENIFLTEDGRIKILDFGLAKLTRPEKSSITEMETATLNTTPGAMLGTVAYMAPEQVQGGRIDPRTDVFAFGVLLYELLAERRPFGGSSVVETAAAILREEPEPILAAVPDVVPALANVISRCLEKRPEDRFSSAHDLALTLETVDSEGSTPEVQGDSFLRERMPHILAVLLAVVIGLLVIFPPSALFDRGSEKTSGPSIRSIAVLPLDNLSGDPSQDFFADGMTDALIAALAKIGALKVISRTSVMRYKGTTTPLPEIANELGVDAVVEGSVVRSGDRVRITAQLIEATTDQHLWAENYERSLTDILALQAEVARAIAGEIQVALTPQDERRLAAAPPVDPKSYEAFLLGQYFLRQETIEGARAALKHFEAGLAHDPDNALALAGTAEVNAYWGRMMGLGDEADRRAEDAAAKALAIDDTLAEAHLALSQVNFTQWKWEAARSELERAIEIKPGLAEAHHGYAHYFWSQGNADAAIIESLRFLELDPQWPRTHECFGFNLTMVGQADRAVGHLHRAIELDPSYYPGHNGLGDAYVQLGELEKAAAEYRTAQGLSADPFAIATLSLAYVAALSGNEAEARAILHELDAEGTEHSAFLVATVDAALGDTNRAFEQLELAYRNKEWWMTTIKIHPWLDPLRDDPRFEDMVRRMNFPEA